MCGIIVSIPDHCLPFYFGSYLHLSWVQYNSRIWCVINIIPIYAARRGDPKLAYNSLVRPQVEYAFSSVWNPYTKANIEKIEKVQQRAARWVTNDYSPYSSVSSITRNLGWWSLEQRRYHVYLTILYKASSLYRFRTILNSQNDIHAISILSHSDKVIPTSAIINVHFPLIIVLWN